VVVALGLDPHPPATPVLVPFAAQVALEPLGGDQAGGAGGAGDPVP